MRREAKSKGEPLIVEKIIDKRNIKGVIKYKVKWLGYSIKESTWEPINNLESAIEMIEAFENTNNNKEMKDSKMLGLKRKNPEYNETEINEKRVKDDESKEISYNKKGLKSSISMYPERDNRPKSPEKIIVPKSPEKIILPKSPERITESKSFHKTNIGKSPEKVIRPKSPETFSKSNQLKEEFRKSKNNKRRQYSDEENDDDTSEEKIKSSISKNIKEENKKSKINKNRHFSDEENEDNKSDEILSSNQYKNERKTQNVSSSRVKSEPMSPIISPPTSPLRITRSSYKNEEYQCTSPKYNKASDNSPIMNNKSKLNNIKSTEPSKKNSEFHNR